MSVAAVATPSLVTTWLDENQAAEYIRLERRAFLRLVRLGEIPSHPIYAGTKRHRYRFTYQELDDWLKRRRKKT